MIHTKDKARKVFLPAIATAMIAFSALSGCKQATPDDASLTQAVQSKLSSDTALASEPIQASVVQGVATLSGTVGSEAARSLASNDVAQVSGIKTVVNDLTVALPGTISGALPSSGQRSRGTTVPKTAPAQKPSAKPAAGVQPSPQEAQ